MRALLVALVGLALLAVCVPPARAQGGAVLVIHLDSEITSATVQYVEAAINAAESDGSPALVVRFDTPGGGLAETQEIQRLFLASRVPILGWVGPSGANSWSAGTFLLESTDYAAMAPYTVIGSAQPVELTPTGFQPVTDAKIINALVASLTETLSIHQRNQSLASSFIVNNVNLNADQALADTAIEGVASSTSELLQKADGFTLPANLTRASPAKPARLNLAGATLADFNRPAGVALYAVLSNPIVSGLLLLLGIYAIIFGLSAPGHGAEIAGIIMVILGVLGFGLSVNVVGIALLVLGIILLILEVKTHSFAVFGTSGIICIILGTIFLAPVGPPQFLISRDTQLVILAALLTPSTAFGVFLLFAVYKVLEVRRRKPVTGKLVGEDAEAVDPIPPNGRGYVRFQGELWQATASEAIEKGERVTIAAKEGVVLTVEKKAVPPSPMTPPVEGSQAT
ncbi:MAG: nodulation protein NfeD [Methanobacteriota archaeon]|nr:MAG: nodulation protein NfeD [Euryarchaeota archaeon]